jgi:hypothetical protein
MADLVFHVFLRLSHSASIKRYCQRLSLAVEATASSRLFGGLSRPGGRSSEGSAPSE